MWHSDDGRDAMGDDPGDDRDEGSPSGDVPAPEARHWRHPSELARHHALPHPDPTPVPVASPLGSPSLIWPLMAVGGCVAVAAVGVLSLQGSLIGAGSVETGPGVSTLPDWAIGLPSLTSVPVGDDGAVDGSAAADGGSTTVTAADATDGGMGSPRPSAGSGAPITPIPDTPAAAPAEVEAPVYGVYAASGREDSRVGCFVFVEDELVTSASAVGRRSTVWVRVGATWLEATVVGTDPLTDVALLELPEPEPSGDGTSVEVSPTEGLPVLDVATEPVETGDPVMVGYGDPAVVAAGDGAGSPAGADASPGPATTRSGVEWTRATSGRNGSEATAASRPDGPSEPGEGSTTSEATAGSQPATTPAPSDDEWVGTSQRRGRVYAVNEPLVTPTNRMINDPIRAAIDPRPGDAGAPLRDRQGRLAGLVVAGDAAKVTAVPIDRVVAAAASLRLWGAGDQVRLGLELWPSRGGLIVESVDQAGPAAGLRPRDLIVSVDGQPVTHPDQLRYRARQAGPDGRLVLTVERPPLLRTIDIAVGTRPTGP